MIRPLLPWRSPGSSPGRAAAELPAAAEPEAALGERRGRAECECTVPGGGRLAGGKPSWLSRGQGSTGESEGTEPPRAGREAESKPECSLPPFGLTRPAGKPAQPRSGLSPAAPDTRNQTRCCEGPCFRIVQLQDLLLDSRHLTKSFTVRKIHLLSGFFSFSRETKK